MSEPKKVDHWAFLATELGAAVPEPEEDIASEISPFGEEIPVAEQPQPEYVPPEEPESQVEEVIVVEQVVEEPAATEPPPVRRERSAIQLGFAGQRAGHRSAARTGAGNRTGTDFLNARSGVGAYRANGRTSGGRSSGRRADVRELIQRSGTGSGHP